MTLISYRGGCDRPTDRPTGGSRDSSSSSSSSSSSLPRWGWPTWCWCHPSEGSWRLVVGGPSGVVMHVFKLWCIENCQVPARFLHFIH